MINVKYLLGSDELCLPHTGLRVAEFGYLLRGFAPEYELHMNELYEKEHGKKRTRKLGGGRGGKLKTAEEKLFFVLYYLKTYQTYATLGGAFDMEKSRAYVWVELLFPPLVSALKKTDWFLLPTLSDWQRSWRNAPKFATFSSTPRSVPSDGVPPEKTNGATTLEKRERTRKRTSR